MKNIIVKIANRLGLLENRYLKFCFHYDFEKFKTYSGSNSKRDAFLDAKIRIIAHTIEKALSLSECRADFGKEKAVELYSLLNEYTGYSTARKDTIELCLATLRVYLNHRTSYGLTTSFLPESISDKQTQVVAGSQRFEIPSSSTTFPEIAFARHSIRDFSPRSIADDDIIRAIKIAQSAPSACNRQATRVYACVNHSIIKDIQVNHGGIRAFGHPGVIFAISQDLSLYMNEYERNTWLVDAGIFCMNLLYALQSVGLGACPVIWGGMKDEDERIAQALSIPSHERVAILVVAGYPPEEGCKTPMSPKRATDTILSIIK